MPTYEYSCPDGHQFERFYRKISDAVSDVVCPVCGKPAERKLSASGFAFKGSGFYLTDYGKNAHRGTGEVVGAAEKSSGESSGESGGAAESKSDGKSPDGPAPAAKGSEATAAPAPPAKSSDAKPSESKPSSSASTSSSTTAPKPDK